MESALKLGQTATADELIACCRGRIAGYKLPGSVEFVEALPKSGVGKIVKHELRARHWKAEARLVS